MMDARGIPTSECPECGGNLIRIDAIFDEEYEVAWYQLDASCSQCGCLLTAPTPLDLPTR